MSCARLDRQPITRTWRQHITVGALATHCGRVRVADCVPGLAQDVSIRQSVGETRLTAPLSKNVHLGFITTIATYDGNNIRYYINGQNLDKFINDVSNYKILITYNGKSFDIPFIENYFNIEFGYSNYLNIGFWYWTYFHIEFSYEFQISISICREDYTAYVGLWLMTNDILPFRSRNRLRLLW